MLQLGRYNIRTPAICPSIMNEKLDYMKEDLEKVLDLGAEIVELRIDRLKDTSCNWRALIGINIPVIATVRSIEEGGYFRGSEDERTELISEAIESGAPCIDIEFSMKKERREELTNLARNNGTKVILSYHNFKTVPTVEGLKKKAKDMKKAKCDLLKIVGFAKDYECGLRILRFLLDSKKEIERPLISFAMGEKGKFTRLAAPLIGSPIVYSSIRDKAAPGQIEYKEIRKILERLDF